MPHLDGSSRRIDGRYYGPGLTSRGVTFSEFLDCIGGTARDSTMGAGAFHIKTLTTRTRYEGTSWRTDHHTRRLRLETSQLIEQAHITEPE
jgi:hypothetical protein